MDNSRIGGKIQKLRQSRGLTQKDLGDLLGYSESFISYIEKGERNISVSDLSKIAKIFNVDHNYFFDKPIIVSQFRADAAQDKQNIDYDEMRDNFINYAKKQEK